MGIEYNRNTPNQKNLLVLTSTFPRYHGDHEPAFVYELCKRLAKKLNVTVLAPHAPHIKEQETMDGILVKRFRYAPTILENLAYKGGITTKLKLNPLYYFLVPFFIIGQTIALCKILRQSSIDIIHAHWLIPQGYIATLSRLFFPNKQFKILCTSHGGDLYGMQGSFSSWIKKYVLTKSDAITVVSKAMIKEVLKLSNDKAKNIHIISMGVDAQATFTPINIERSKHELLFVGRLVEKKGVSVLIESMPRIIKKFPDAILNIVGNGPELENLKLQAKQLGIEDRIHFLGALTQADLPDLYRHTTIFVAPSIVAANGDQEGLGLVFAEALACECAVVATDLPAIADLIIDGQTGVIAKQKDSTDLANQIIMLLGDQELRNAIGRNGRKHVIEHFDWEIIANRYNQLIDNITSSNHYNSSP